MFYKLYELFGVCVCVCVCNVMIHDTSNDTIHCRIETADFGFQLNFILKIFYIILFLRFEGL